MTNNPYVQHLMQKGYTVAELRRPVARPVVPEHLRDLYSSYAEYEEAIHEMLNGM